MTKDEVEIVLKMFRYELKENNLNDDEIKVSIGYFIVLMSLFDILELPYYNPNFPILLRAIANVIDIKRVADLREVEKDSDSSLKL